MKRLLIGMVLLLLAGAVLAAERLLPNLLLQPPAGEVVSEQRRLFTPHFPAAAGPTLRERDEITECRELEGYLLGVLEAGYQRYRAQPLLVDNLLPPIMRAESPQAGIDYSQTNVQEAGVDEPDLIKSDGEWIYIANAGYFSVLRGYPPSAMELHFSQRLEGEVQGLLLHQGLALVITSQWGESPLWRRPLATVQTRVVLFDVREPRRPQVLRELLLEGSFNTARRVGDRLHLVVESWLHDYRQPPLAFATAAAGPSPLLRLGAPWQRLTAAAGGGVLPQLQDRRYRSGGALEIEQRPLTACRDVLLPVVPEGANTLSIVTLNLQEPLAPVKSTTLVSDQATLYATPDQLYVATTQSPFWMPGGAPQERTRIHRFSLGEQAQLQASGEVAGGLLNRYALGAHAGYLRVATTENRWGERGSDPRNTLLVLDAELREVGRLEGLGKPGERIFAVRFAGTRGYLVTFAQIDPLYTLDLSEPSAPRVVGELEVPGFSTYLHPIGEHHLLGIGMEPEDWSSEVSLYEVSDFANPRLLDRVNLGAYSGSEALYEPKAFTWFAPLHLLIIPVQSAGEPEAVVWRVDPQLGLQELGRVSHAEQVEEPGGAAIRRSLLIGREGVYTLYTLSNGLLQGADAELPWQQQGMVPLPWVEPEFWIGI